MAGERRPWPEALAANGESRRLDRVRPAETHSCLKFYVPPEQPVAWAGLAHEGLGCQLRLEWNPERLSWHVGGEGVYNSAPVAALEPSNGYYDSLERAVLNHKVMILEPGETRDWMIVLRIGFSA